MVMRVFGFVFVGVEKARWSRMEVEMLNYYYTVFFGNNVYTPYPCT
jgi:hypothetical protein